MLHSQVVEQRVPDIAEETLEMVPEDEIKAAAVVEGRASVEGMAGGTEVVEDKEKDIDIQLLEHAHKLYALRYGSMIGLEPHVEEREQDAREVDTVVAPQLKELDRCNQGHTAAGDTEEEEEDMDPVALAPVVVVVVVVMVAVVLEWEEVLAGVVLRLLLV